MLKNEKICPQLYLATCQIKIDNMFCELFVTSELNLIYWGVSRRKSNHIVEIKYTMKFSENFAFTLPLT